MSRDPRLRAVAYGVLVALAYHGTVRLSSGFAGELLHRLGLYGIRMAAVVSDPSRCSRSCWTALLIALPTSSTLNQSCRRSLRCICSSTAAA